MGDRTDSGGEEHRERQKRKVQSKGGTSASGKVQSKRTATGRQHSTTEPHSQSCGLQSNGGDVSSSLSRSGCVRFSLGFHRGWDPPPNADLATPLAAGGENVC